MNATEIMALKTAVDGALLEFASLRQHEADQEIKRDENAADQDRQAADPHPVPLVVVGIVQREGELRVDLASASEMSFAVRMSELEYEKTIADICHVAPAMMLYDAALMESYDDAGRTKIPIIASEPVKDFVKRYRKHLVNISVELPPFQTVKRR